MSWSHQEQLHLMNFHVGETRRRPNRIKEEFIIDSLPTAHVFYFAIGRTQLPRHLGTIFSKIQPNFCQKSFVKYSSGLVTSMPFRLNDLSKSNTI